MHVADEAEVVLVARRLADGAAPFFDCLEDLVLDASAAYGRAFWEAADELIEELLCRDLEVEWVATVLDAVVEEVEGEKGDILVAVVDVVDNGDGSLARGGALFCIYEVADLQVEGEIGLVVLGAAGARDEALELGGSRYAELVPAVARRRSGRGGLHDYSSSAVVTVDRGRWQGEGRAGAGASRGRVVVGDGVGMITERDRHRCSSQQR